MKRALWTACIAMVLAGVAAAENKEKAFTVDKKYLVMPIQNNGKGGEIKLFVDGKEVRRYSLKLAENADTADWYTFFTIENYKGRKARVVHNNATDAGFALVAQSESSSRRPWPRGTVSRGARPEGDLVRLPRGRYADR